MDESQSGAPVRQILDVNELTGSDAEGDDSTRTDTWKEPSVRQTVQNVQRTQQKTTEDDRREGEREREKGSR